MSARPLAYSLTHSNQDRKGGDVAMLKDSMRKE